VELSPIDEWHIWHLPLMIVNVGVLTQKETCFYITMLYEQSNIFSVILISICLYTVYQPSTIFGQTIQILRQKTNRNKILLSRTVITVRQATYFQCAFLITVILQKSCRYSVELKNLCIYLLAGIILDLIMQGRHIKSDIDEEFQCSDLQLFPPYAYHNRCPAVRHIDRIAQKQENGPFQQHVAGLLVAGCWLTLLV
jgi:hypothetical protein